MLIILAVILPLKATVTLSAILTAALLFLAVREKALFWMQTAVAIAMLWRGEFWKAAFLESEQRLSEQLQQQQRHTSSKTEFGYPVRAFVYGDVRQFDRAACSLRRPLVLAVADAHERLLGSPHEMAFSAGTRLILRRYKTDSRRDPAESSLKESINLPYENHRERHPNTKFTARKSWAWLDVELFGYEKTEGRTAAIQPVTLKVLDKDDVIEPEPFLSITPDSAQRLMDALWDVGLRPTEGTGSAGAYEAQEKHLQDMRALVARTVGVEFK